MSTNTHSVTSAAWVKITDESTGSLFLQTGEKVALTQATSLPTTEILDTPLLGTISLNQEKVYYRVPAGSYIYARAMGVPSTLTNTPSE